MGRNMKPTVLKKLEGTYRKDRAVKNEMQGRLITILPPAPRELDKYGKRVWRQLGPVLIRSHALQDLDLFNFKLLCMWGGYILQDSELIRKEKTRVANYTNKSGATNKVISVHFRNQQISQKQFDSMAREFGLTPAARTKISTTNPGEQASIFDYL